MPIFPKLLGNTISWSWQSLTLLIFVGHWPAIRNRILANYGLIPFGKVPPHFCLQCEAVVEGRLWAMSEAANKVVVGILTASMPSPMNKNLSILTDVLLTSTRYPGVYSCVGKKTLTRLLGTFGTEMSILHEASVEDLAEVVGPKIAENIAAAGEGR